VWGILITERCGRRQQRWQKQKNGNGKRTLATCTDGTTLFYCWFIKLKKYLISFYFINVCTIVPLHCTQTCVWWSESWW
jgi:hypothetical protein